MTEKGFSISIDFSRGISYHLHGEGGCVEEKEGGAHHVGGGVVHQLRHTLLFAEVFKPNPLE